ncbi:hypothetical protein [Embleya scabrispora]|uniref:hypothetical protein n=1 Tax=Embleya scabrispora TaxID=159449 RepID=UPI00036A5225|nr:hypothetical protein [Embleya scabrispora]MYS80824.1 hypothetical protein [Streptomyces sp. SID5474]
MPTPESYPSDPRDWTTDHVARFWKANGKRTVRCELSGRIGTFAAVINLQAFVRLPGGTEFRTRCANLRVLEDEAAAPVPASESSDVPRG